MDGKRDTYGAVVQPWVKIDIGSIVLTALTAADDERARYSSRSSTGDHQQRVEPSK